MNKILAAIALTIALPAVAYAQSAPAPAPMANCCETMNDKDCCKDKSKMDCCKGMDHSKMDHSQHDMKAGANPHAGHDMSQSGAATPSADPHASHQN